MKLPTSYLQEPTRSAVRFTIVGGIGTALQYAIYYGFLMLFEYKLGLDEELRVNVAFILGFGLEMITILPPATIPSNVNLTGRMPVVL